MLFRFFLNIFVCLCFLASSLCAKEPRLWNVPFDQKDFFGRLSEINRLHKDLESGPVMITGRSGVGKSAFAAHYARHYYDRYKVIWTLKADQSVEEQMDDFALKLHETFGKKTPLMLKKKGDGRAYVKDFLRTAAFSWLLIFDNAPSYAVITDDLPETHGAKDKHVIVTSLSERDGLGILRLTSLTDVEALSFLSHYLKDARMDDLKALARTLENHPLALLQAAAYINATPGMGVPAYIAFFTENKKAYWASESKALGDQPLLYTAIKMSIDKIKSTSPEDYTLLVALSLLDTTHLDKTLIEKMYINLTKGDMAGFGRLLDVALIAPEGNAAYRIHDYVRSVILESASHETLKKAATLSASVFLSLFPEKIEDCVGVFDQNPHLFAHMKKLFDHPDLIADDGGLQVGMRLFYYSEIRNRDFDFAVPYKDKIKKLFDEKGKDAAPMLCGLFYSNYGCTVLTGGTVDDSIAEFKKAYAYFKKADPEEARKELIGLLTNRLGFFYHWKGDLNKVKELLTEAKQLVGSDTDVFLTCSIDELEAVYEQDLGNFERSIDILNKEYARLENDPNRKTYWPFAGSLKVASLLKLSRFQEAEALLNDIYQEALDASNGNADDDMIGRISVYLSQAQSGLGHYRQAEASAKKAIEIINRCYQGTHQIRRQGVAHMALADAYLGQKRFKEAIAEYKIAEEVFNKISSYKTFDDMSELYAKTVNVAIILKEEMVAREYALRHLETFPKSHDRFVDIAIQMTKAGYYR